jgi:hypothetical protein
LAGQSIILKEGRSHELYELFRSPGATEEEKLQHYTAMKRAWNDVPVPKGICDFGHRSVFIDRATDVLIGLENLKHFGAKSSQRLAPVRSAGETRLMSVKSTPYLQSPIGMAEVCSFGVMEM